MSLKMKGGGMLPMFADCILEFIGTFTLCSKGSSILLMEGAGLVPNLYNRLLSATKTVWVVRLCLDSLNFAKKSFAAMQM